MPSLTHSQQIASAPVPGTLHMTEDTPMEEVYTFLRNHFVASPDTSAMLTGLVGYNEKGRSEHNEVRKAEAMCIARDVCAALPDGVYTIKIMGTKTVTAKEYANVCKLRDGGKMRVLPNKSGVTLENAVLPEGTIRCEEFVAFHKTNDTVFAPQVMVQGPYSNFTKTCIELLGCDIFKNTRLSALLANAEIRTMEHVIQLLKAAWALLHCDKEEWNLDAPRSQDAMQKSGFLLTTAEPTRKGFAAYNLENAKKAVEGKDIKAAGSFAPLTGSVFKALDGKNMTVMHEDGGFDPAHPLHGFSLQMLANPAANLTTSAACAALTYLDPRTLQTLQNRFAFLTLVEGAMHGDGAMTDGTWGGAFCAWYVNRVDLVIFMKDGKPFPFYNFLGFGHSLFIACVFDLATHSDLYPIELRKAALQLAGLDTPIQNTGEEMRDAANFVTPDNKFLNKGRFFTFVNNMTKLSDDAVAAAVSV